MTRPVPSKRTCRRVLTGAAASLTATTITLAPITPTPDAEAEDLFVYSAGLITGPLFTTIDTIYNLPVLKDILPTLELPFAGLTVPYLVSLFTWKYPLPYPRGIANGQLALQDGDFIGTNIVGGVMDGALAIGQAIKIIQDEIVPEPGVNHYYYLLFRNPGRANGGIAARFDWLYSLFGLAQSAVSGDGIGKVHNYGPGSTGFYDSIKLDMGLGYDSMSDFPVSPYATVSILNSLVQSFLPTNLLGPVDVISESHGSTSTGLNVFLTVVPQQAALLEPLRLPGRLLGLLGLPNIYFALNALADVLERPVDILTNVGYSDVDLATYERSFDQFAFPNKQFFIDSTLTFDQYLTAIGDAIGAAFSGVQQLFANGLTGLLAAGSSTAPSASLTAEKVEHAVSDALSGADAADASEPEPGAAEPESSAAEARVARVETKARDTSAPTKTTISVAAETATDASEPATTKVATESPTDISSDATGKVSESPPPATKRRPNTARPEPHRRPVAGDAPAERVTDAVSDHTSDGTAAESGRDSSRASSSAGDAAA